MNVWISDVRRLNRFLDDSVSLFIVNGAGSSQHREVRHLRAVVGRKHLRHSYVFMTLIVLHSRASMMAYGMYHTVRIL
jgi:hypothetical protein